MKKILILIIVPLLSFFLLSCDEDSSGGGDGDSTDVSIPSQIDNKAEEYDNFPTDAEVVETSTKIDGEDVTGTDTKDLGTTSDDTLEVEVTIPSELSSRAAYSAVTIQLWINGSYSDVEHDGTSQVVTITVPLVSGNNIFTIVFEKDGKSYRSATYHIFHLKLDATVIGNWIRTEEDFDTSNEKEGFEITSDGKLYNTELQNGSWVQESLLAEYIAASEESGVLVSYDPDYPFASLYESTITFSSDKTKMTITEGSNKIYGVKETSK